MQTRQFILAPPTDLSGGAQLGFYAKSVWVSNPTAAWYFLPDQQITIPPGQIGAVYSLGGTERANIVFQAPLGVSQPTTSFEGQVIFNYSEEQLAPSAGVNSYSLMPAGANSLFFSLPAGTPVVIDLKGPTNRFSAFMFNAAGANSSGRIDVSIAIAVAGVGLNVFDSWSMYWATDSSGTAGETIPIVIPYSLPARARITLTQNNGTFFGAAFY